MTDDQIQILPPGLVHLVEAVLIIAREGKTTKGDVSKRLGLHCRYFEPYFRFLTKAGVTTSLTGPTGGVWLARPAAGISVGELARVCATVAISITGREHTRSLQWSPHPLIGLMRSRMVAQMDAVTIADLLADPYFDRELEPRKRWAGK